MFIFIPGAFVKLEFIAWCDKLAIDSLRQVAPARRSSSLANDRRVRLASQLLINRHITPGQFLQRTAEVMHAATHYGLRMTAEDDDDSDDDSDGESDSESDSEIDGDLD